MPRGGTALVVLVVAAIALAAGFDALRGDDPPQPAAESEPPPAPPTTTADQPVEEEQPPLTDELGGTLYFTDESCELQATALPPGPRAVDPPDPPNWDECRFALSPNGRRVAGADTGWDPYSDPLIGRVFQHRDGTIQVSTNAGPEGEPFAGTAPAWRGDGTLTYFADGAVREWQSGDVVLSQRDLLQALRTLEIPELATRYDRFRVREAAWLDDRRLAAILSAEGPEFREDMLAIYDGTELAQYTFDGAGGLSELRVSPGGRYAAAKSTGGRDAPGGFVMIEAGRELNTPQIDGYRAVAWSPDEQWAAVAADGGVFVFRPGESGAPELQLGLVANDLDWRGELGLDAVPASGGGTTEAAAFLAGAGVDGLLYFTQQNEGRCRLRALEIPTLEPAEAPPDSQGFCRFTVEPDGLIHPGDVGGIAAAPSGRPTYVLDGELFAGQPGNRAELLVSAANLEELFGAPAALEEVAWVDEERFWAVVRSEGADGIALMTADAVVYAPWFAAPTIEGLRLGPGGMVAASSDRGVAILGDDGRRLILTEGRDVAWAPGEPIAAVSTRDGILFVAPLSGEEVTLPLEVSDLDWVAP
jgi:hypothetical protein